MYLLISHFPKKTTIREGFFFSPTDPWWVSMTSCFNNMCHGTPRSSRNKEPSGSVDFMSCVCIYTWYISYIHTFWNQWSFWQNNCKIILSSSLNLFFCCVCFYFAAALPNSTRIFGSLPNAPPHPVSPVGIGIKSRLVGPGQSWRLLKRRIQKFQREENPGVAVDYTH